MLDAAVWLDLFLKEFWAYCVKLSPEDRICARSLAASRLFTCRTLASWYLNGCVCNSCLVYFRFFLLRIFYASFGAGGRYRCSLLRTSSNDGGYNPSDYEWLNVCWGDVAYGIYLSCVFLFLSFGTVKIATNSWGDTLVRLTTKCCSFSCDGTG